MQSRCAIQRWRFPRQDVITSLTGPGISINLVAYRTEEAITKSSTCPELDAVSSRGGDS